MPSVKDILKRIKKDGWFLHRHGASHDLYRHPFKDGQLTLPRHGSKEMAKGTFNSILKGAGLK